MAPPDASPLPVRMALLTVKVPALTMALRPGAEEIIPWMVRFWMTALHGVYHEDATVVWLPSRVIGVLGALPSMVIVPGQSPSTPAVPA